MLLVVGFLEVVWWYLSSSNMKLRVVRCTVHLKIGNVDLRFCGALNFGAVVNLTF